MARPSLKKGSRNCKPNCHNARSSTNGSLREGVLSLPALLHHADLYGDVQPVLTECPPVDGSRTIQYDNDALSMHTKRVSLRTLVQGLLFLILATSAGAVAWAAPPA